jgi:glycosyltransferase involved in cell wall biosynthesis
MDIVIVANFCGDFSETDNYRFSYLANVLCETNEVEIVTSKFLHTAKKNRKFLPKHKYKITLIDELGYAKNVCLKRFFSHFMWGANVMRYFKNRKKPDVVYCAVPSLSAPYHLARYCKKNKIRYIIDVQDLWPEGFQMVFNIPIVSYIIYLPFRCIANYIYKSADEVIAVSQTYVDRVMRVNRKCKKGHSVFLGTELKTFDRNANKETDLKKRPNEIWLAYCGTLGSSYDLTSVIKAVAKVNSNNLKFIIMGDGPLKDKFTKQAIEERINAIFTGRLAYDEMCSLLKKCDIAINPIMPGAAQSIINKHADYAMAGLPVINTQENKEYRDLLNKYQCGINCRTGSVKDIAKALERLISFSNERKTMGVNSRYMAEEKFERSVTYRQIADVVEERK